MADVRPVRVLQVIGRMDRGGAENMIMNLYRRIDRTKVQFDFVEHYDKRAAFDDEIESLGGKVYQCPKYTGKNHFAYQAWWRAFLKEYGAEYRIVHGHIGSTAAIYLSLCKKYGLFTIAHSHNARTHWGTSELIYAAFAFSTRFIADQMFACSQAAAVSRYGKRVASNQTRCRVLNNAIDTQRFEYNPAIRQRMREMLGLNDMFVIGHVGRFDSNKNQTQLVEIFEEVHKRCPKSALLMVGEGVQFEDIKDIVQKKGLVDCVIMPGSQANTEDYYQAMDYFVFPSLTEGLPVTLIEAQTAGLRCVISDAIPQECILTSDLVTIQRLSDAPDVWAEHICSRIDYQRNSHKKEIADAGYDIENTAGWLEDFYIEYGKK